MATRVEAGFCAPVLHGCNVVGLSSLLFCVPATEVYLLTSGAPAPALNQASAETDIPST